MRVGRLGAAVYQPADGDPNPPWLTAMYHPSASSLVSADAQVLLVSGSDTITFSSGKTLRFAQSDSTPIRCDTHVHGAWWYNDDASGTLEIPALRRTDGAIVTAQYRIASRDPFDLAETKEAEAPMEQGQCNPAVTIDQDGLMTVDPVYVYNNAAGQLSAYKATLQAQPLAEGETSIRYRLATLDQLW